MDLRRIKSQSSSTCKWVVDDANGYYKVYNSISIQYMCVLYKTYLRLMRLESGSSSLSKRIA